jgi:hypothetical protein
MFRTEAQAAISVGLAGFVLLLVPLYRHLTVTGLEAEAKIMMSYLYSLEMAYHADTGHYTYFDKWYGAPIGGTNHCNQPNGARDLGFSIRWCRGEGKSETIRFSYRVVPHPNEPNGFLIEALSGSDERQMSFVCLTKGESHWSFDQRKTLKQAKGC